MVDAPYTRNESWSFSRTPTLTRGSSDPTNHGCSCCDRCALHIFMFALAAATVEVSATGVAVSGVSAVAVFAATAAPTAPAAIYVADYIANVVTIVATAAAAPVAASAGAASAGAAAVASRGQILEEIKREGLTPDVTSFNIAVHACAVGRQWQV